jgi:hypothetical protein
MAVNNGKVIACNTSGGGWFEKKNSKKDPSSCLLQAFLAQRSRWHAFLVGIEEKSTAEDQALQSCQLRLTTKRISSYANPHITITNLQSQNLVDVECAP